MAEDPCLERSLKFKRELQNCVCAYNQIYNDLVKSSRQTRITDFLTKADDSRKTEELDSEEDTIAQAKKRSVKENLIFCPLRFLFDIHIFIFLINILGFKKKIM